VHIEPEARVVRPVLSVDEMRAADARATVAEKVLIARAGQAVAREALGLLGGGGYGRRVVVVAGKGNNGADGRVAARRLAARGAKVEVVEAAGGDGTAPTLGRCDLVIDAAYGTGFRGSYLAPDPRGTPVLAVDIPSGVDGDTGWAEEGAVRATATVTFAALKPGLLLGSGPTQAGRVTVADIGLDVGERRASLIEDADLAAWLPPRSRHAHKWDRAVWVVAGSPGMGGSAALCSRAAQRAGAGMVRVGSPGVTAADHPAGEAVARTLPATGWVSGVLADLDRFGSVVVGPGLGRGPHIADAVAELLASSPVPVVVDADGLNALGSGEDLRAIVGAAKAPVVLTPHDGEFARLNGEPPGRDRMGSARALAAATGAVVLLKGSATVVADPDGGVLLVVSGDARLATAGTGDVLAGVIGAFLAAGVAPHQAAALAAHVHGRAALLGPKVGLVAGDVVELLPRVLSGGG
jgi:ADP-dependent NAD(P)H-hydrate dehydratase / NAD(P)H-hydrate epimerase